MRFDPLEHPIAWSPIRFLVPDPWLAHAPLAMVLVELLRPHRIVELGTKAGVSYSAFLQAADELGLAVRAVAVPARGRGHAPSVEHFRRYHDAEYASVSSIADAGDDAAREALPDGSVDLLSIHPEGLARVGQFAAWQPKLSPTAVVVLSGIAGDVGGSSVHALWNQLQSRHRAYRTTNGNGLAIVAVGPEAPGRLDVLLDLPAESCASVQAYFSRLGAELLGEASRVQRVIEEKDAVIAERDEAVSWLRSELSLVRRSVRLLEQRADWYALQLETIFASRSWRWLARYRRLRERLGLRPGHPLAGSARHPSSLDEPAGEPSPPAPPGLEIDVAAVAGQDARRSLTLLPKPRLDQMSALFDEPSDGRPRRQMDIICLAIIDWEFRFQRPQQMATQFAAHGHRVFYVSPARYRRGERVPGVRELDDNIYEVELGTDRSPDIYGEDIGGATADGLIASLETLRQTYDITSAATFVMISSWTTVAERARTRWGWPILYDCMDEWENFQGIKSAIVEAEQRLVRSCDLLVVTAARLEAKWAPLGRPMVLARNAADVEFYAARYRPNTLLQGLAHPIVGYYGAIADWFDLDLMVHIARSRPGYQFVLLGGVFGVDVAELSGLPNVSLLGQQPYATMPLYLYHFDVCLIPFKVNPITEATDPVKLYEYLSAGKPVVSVDLPELAPCREHIYVASTAGDFLAKLDEAVAEDDRGRRERRRSFVAENTWAARYRTVRAGIVSIARRAAVIIVTYNNLPLTRLCLESVLHNTDHPNYEVIVVDNASTDGTPAYLRFLAGQHPHVRILLNPVNHGFARANNQGLAMTVADDLVLLNNDTVVPHGWLTRLLGHLADPAIGLVGPVTNFVGNEAKIDAPYHTWGEMEEFAAERWRRYEGQKADISMLAMFCVGFRRDVLERIGPLDEQFGVGMFEDDDYARRIDQAGLRIVCAADTFVHHVGQAAFKVLIERGDYDALFDENRRRYEAKWGRAWTKHEHRPLPFVATTFPPPPAESGLGDA